jgi:hypothetical protein
MSTYAHLTVSEGSREPCATRYDFDSPYFLLILMALPDRADVPLASALPRTPSRPRAVTIVRPGEPAEAEGLVANLIDRGPGLRVELLLDDGTSAVAFLPKLDVSWLDLRAGDIVPVQRVAA